MISKIQKRTWAEIDLAAIRHNYTEIRRVLKPETKLLCVIKANAYGHGAERLAAEYSRLGADWFAVSSIEEAVPLRTSGVTKPILILGYTPLEAADILTSMNISQCVYSLEYAKALSAAATGPIKIHIKIDTGMSRIGFRDPDEIRESCGLPNLVPEGVFTHFASADEGEDGESFTRMQFDRFTRTIEECGVDFELKHCCNSAGITDYPEFHLDMVRAGIILYGYQPSGDVRRKLYLVPAMTLRSVVSQVKTIHAGDKVSYGRTFTAGRDMKVATIPVGYADGYWRSNSMNESKVIVNGVACPIIGRVCMDQLMVNADNVPDLTFGSSSDVELFGKRQTADVLAANNGTINYEVLCAVGARVPRIYINEQCISL